MQFTDFHLIQPVFILPSDQLDLSNEEYNRIADVTVKIQDWFLAYERAALIASPLQFRIPQFATHFSVDPLEKVTHMVYTEYPSVMQQGEVLALVFVKGATSNIIGALGWGWTQYCMVAWDSYLDIGNIQKENITCGVICHELGHALGLPHMPNIPNNVMWHHYRWPGVSLPEVVMSGVHAAPQNPNEVCPVEE